MYTEKELLQEQYDKGEIDTLEFREKMEESNKEPREKE
jgi:hypothetical protein